MRKKRKSHLKVIFTFPNRRQKNLLSDSADLSHFHFLCSKSFLSRLSYLLSLVSTHPLCPADQNWTVVWTRMGPPSSQFFKSNQPCNCISSFITGGLQMLSMERWLGSCFPKGCNNMLKRKIYCGLALRSIWCYHQYRSTLMSITGFSSQSKRTCSLKIQFQTFLSLIIVSS